MSVKRSRSAARTLVVLEAVAQRQPVGVSALARHLDADKSAVQRALMTLADDGWIRIAPGPGAQWELTPRLLAIALPPSSAQELRRRARPLLERLRAETSETVYLAVPDAHRFVVVEALESVQMLRMVPPIGMVVPLPESATGRAALSISDEPTRTAFLGRAADAALARELDAVRARGFAINDGEIDPASTSIAAAVPGPGGGPVAAIVVTGPRERIGPARHRPIGLALIATAAELSCGLAA